MPPSGNSVAESGCCCCCCMASGRLRLVTWALSIEKMGYGIGGRCVSFLMWAGVYAGVRVSLCIASLSSPLVTLGQHVSSPLPFCSPRICHDGTQSLWSTPLPRISLLPRPSSGRNFEGLLGWWHTETGSSVEMRLI